MRPCRARGYRGSGSRSTSWWAGSRCAVASSSRSLSQSRWQSLARKGCRVGRHGGSHAGAVRSGRRHRQACVLESVTGSHGEPAHRNGTLDASSGGGRSLVPRRLSTLCPGLRTGAGTFLARCTCAPWAVLPVEQSAGSARTSGLCASRCCQTGIQTWAPGGLASSHSSSTAPPCDTSAEASSISIAQCASAGSVVW